MFETNFGSIDWVIVVVYLVGAVAAGLLVNRYIHSVADYMVGGRGSGAALNVATYIGTGLGLVTLMYASIDALTHGFAYVTLAVIGAAVGLLLGSTGFVIGRLRRMNLLTIQEYFEHRFGKRTRITAGVICAAAGILNMGMFPKLGATFITYSTGLSADGNAQLTVNIITSVLIVLVVLYTVVGGMVSVIVTDFLQFIVLSVGLGLAVWFALSNPNLGWDRMVTTMQGHRGEAAFNPVAMGGYGWVWVLFNVAVFFGAALCWAPEASRMLTSTSERATRRTFFYAGPAQFVRLAIPALLAVAAFCMISQHPDMRAHFFPEGLDGAADARHAGQALPLLLGKIVPSGILGLLVAGVMAAFMSTHDSYLLCWSSVITRDVIGPSIGRPLSDREQIRITRWVVVSIGVFLLVFGVWVKTPDSVWNYMAVTGTIYISGSTAALIGGIYWKRASSKGAVAALLAGTIAVVGLFLDVPVHKQWLGLGCFALCAVLFVVVSLIWPDKPKADAVGQSSATVKAS
ncbi:MAG: hypothetical protein CMJ49_04095 [Planctomycetaceae bacterium]|nr:hypothetical protein [Planctomycetaceae bacterium]